MRVLDQSNLEKVSLRITNSAFRYVCLHRRGLHPGSLAEATKVGIIPGATPLTIGSLGTILRLPESGAEPPSWPPPPLSMR